MKVIVNNTDIFSIYLDELSRPSNISLVGVYPSELVFEWNSVTHNCAAILYSVMITNPDCGNCATTVNSTTISCSIGQLVANEVRMCTIRVQGAGVLCGNNISGPSSEAHFRLQGTYIIIINALQAGHETEKERNRNQKISGHQICINVAGHSFYLALHNCNC